MDWVPISEKLLPQLGHRNTSLTFEELHDMLEGHDSYLRCLESSTQQLIASANYSHHNRQHNGAYGGSYSKGSYKPNGHTRPQTYSKTTQGSFKDNRRPSTPRYHQRHYQPKCQFCDQMGHTAKSCLQVHRSKVTANCTVASQPENQKWLFDSTASHNTTGDLKNLSVYSEYDGTDEVVIDDGSGLTVSHIGSLTLKSPKQKFILCDTLCVPNICKNLIYVHHFTSHNNVFIEFHPFYFLVKDQTTGVTLLRGACESDIYHRGPIMCYILVYVDDLVFTGNDTTFVQSLIQQLGAQFSLKDMGPLNFFLDMEVVSTCAGLFLSQHQYIRDLLSRTSMVGAKDVSTPLSTGISLKLDDGTAFVNSGDFRRVLGSLQYLSLTRPDISFVVNKLSQFMHRPTTTHWTTVKRLLRYLKQTIFHGIHIQKATAWHLTTYSDVDWAGNFDDHTSTSAYISFLGHNPISWSSKKQRAIARSSIKVEYRSLANAASETI